MTLFSENQGTPKDNMGSHEASMAQDTSPVPSGKPTGHPTERVAELMTAHEWEGPFTFSCFWPTCLQHHFCFKEKLT